MNLEVIVPLLSVVQMKLCDKGLPSGGKLFGMPLFLSWIHSDLLVPSMIKKYTPLEKILSLEYF